MINRETLKNPDQFLAFLNKIQSRIDQLEKENKRLSARVAELEAR